MNHDSENFEPLRRLLALKRHEQPPPGYFHNFSAQVIARLQADEAREASLVDSLPWDVPWLRRLWVALEAKPLLAAGVGLMACVLLVAGVVASEKGESMASIPQAPSNPFTQFASSPPISPMIDSSSLVDFSSMTGVAPAQHGSLFEQFKREQRTGFPAQFIKATSN